MRVFNMPPQLARRVEFPFAVIAERLALGALADLVIHVKSQTI